MAAIFVCPHTLTTKGRTLYHALIDGVQLVDDCYHPFSYISTQDALRHAQSIADKLCAEGLLPPVAMHEIHVVP